MTPQQHNEQVKTVMALLSNGGLALFAAFAAVIYNGRGTDGALGMVIVAIGLILASLTAALFLREES